MLHRSHVSLIHEYGTILLQSKDENEKASCRELIQIEMALIDKQFLIKEMKTKQYTRFSNKCLIQQQTDRIIEMENRLLESKIDEKQKTECDKVIKSCKQRIRELEG